MAIHSWRRLDKVVPSVDIWKECLRVLKPGAFMCAMSAPRADVQCAMISQLIEAGFRLDFTPMYWTYATGLPKAGSMSKLVDKRLGTRQEKTGIVRTDGVGPSEMVTASGRGRQLQTVFEQTKASSSQAQALNGSYAGFQPKPALEVILIAMKPLSEQSYVDHALKNGKGIGWLDDGRIPVSAGERTAYSIDGGEGSPTVHDFGARIRVAYRPHAGGRFPMNLLVSDDALHTSGRRGHTDAASYSSYFDLDAWWAKTLPFLVVPKATKRERN